MKRTFAIGLIILAVLSLLACGNSQQAGVDPGTGGITAAAVWPGGPSAKAGVILHKAPSEVSWVRMIVSKGSTTFSADFDAALGSGSISAVPAGTGWTLTFAGLNAAKTAVYYEGSKGNITVTGGQTTNAGSVAMRVMPGLAGSLDTSFGGSGLISTPIGTNSYSRALVEQPDGKIVVVGDGTVAGNVRQFAVVRYNANGTLDPSFGSNGIVTTATGSISTALAVAIQKDGKLVVAGYAQDYTAATNVAVARYLPDGRLDTAANGSLSPFGGTAGFVTYSTSTFNDSANTLALQSDGKIVIGGTSTGSVADDALLMRLNGDGTLDPTFNAGGPTPGILKISFASNADGIQSIKIQPDGKIVATGYASNPSPQNLLLARFTPFGSLDTTFATTGYITHAGSSAGKSLWIQPDGKYVVGGDFVGATTSLSITRFSPTDGSPDPSFGTSGIVRTALGGADTLVGGIQIQPDGKIVAAAKAGNGGFYQYAMIRYDAAGNLDNTFGAGGVSYAAVSMEGNEASAIGIQADGKLVASGSSSSNAFSRWSFSIIRLWNDVTTTKRVYTANSSNTISVISTVTNTLAADMALISSPSFSVNVAYLAVDPQANRLYASNSGGLGTQIFVVDTINNTLVSAITFTTGDRGPGRIIVDPASNRAYVSLYGINGGSGGDGNRVAVIDTSTNSILSLITVGYGPRGLALDPAANRLYSVSSVDKKVYVIDTITNTVVGTIPSSGTFGNDLGSAAIDIGKKKLYVTNQNNLLNTPDIPGQHLLFVIDLTTNTVAKSLTTGNNPLAVVVDPVDSRAYVSNMDSNSVTIVDTTTDTVLAGGPHNIIVGTSPRGMALDDSVNPKILYIANYIDSTVSVLDVTNIVPRNPIPVGTGPIGVAVAP